MNNPWEEIKLDDYEKHMSLDSVKQLQTINKMMKEQFDAYQVNTAMIFGIAGGNGLEHVSKENRRDQTPLHRGRPQGTGSYPCCEKDHRCFRRAEISQRGSV